MKIVELATAQNAAVNVTSVHYDLGDLTTYAIAVDFTGGGGNLAGTLTLECSNTGNGAGSDWVTIPTSTQAVTSSASHVWNVTGAGYRFIRAVWNYTSGTGNISIRLVAKENVVKGA